MINVGIAITTYNRSKAIVELIKDIQRLSVCTINLVVCDDGSSDDTIEQLNTLKIPYITGPNKGIAWNKNRGIYYLANFTNSEVFILLDDDVLPYQYGWDFEWAVAAKRYGHVCYKNRDWHLAVIAGDETLHDPGIGQELQGVCICFSREAFAQVGYMDTRFDCYGWEHVEYSVRYIRNDLGGYELEGDDHYFILMDSGIRQRDFGTYGSDSDIMRAREVYEEVLKERIAYKLPWRNQKEKDEFLKEFKHLSTISFPERIKDFKGFNKEKYLELNRDLACSTWKSNPIKHFLTYGWKEKRSIK